MLNSSNYTRDTNVLLSGEQVESEIHPDVLNDPKTKVYYHTVPGAKTILADGAECVFRGGMYATQNPTIIEHMEKIANKRGTLVYTKDKEGALKDVNLAAEDAKAPAAEANVMGGKTLPLAKPIAA